MSNDYSELDFPWRNEVMLRELYIEEDLTAEEVADEFGCSWRTVLNWTKKFDLRKNRKRDEDVYIVTDSCGYELITDGADILRHHQLVAIYDGADPYKVFSNGEHQTHHTTKLPWLNIPGTVEVVPREEHKSIHSKDKWVEINGVPQITANS